MSKIFEDFAEFMKTQPYELTRVSMMKDGEIETIEFNPANPCQNSYSVAKSFTMTAIGILYDRGLVKLDEKICDIFPDEFTEKSDKRWQDCTVEMALTHCLGLPGGFLDIDCNPSSEFGEDYLRYMFEYPLEYDPGTDSKYSDGAYYLLSCIVEKKSGMKTDDFLWKNLLYKMGFQEFAWSHCPKGHAMGATGLYLHSSDMVKLGYLYLNHGVYNGEQLISEEWAKLAPEKGYAFGWDEQRPFYAKGGMCGQKLAVLPEKNCAIAVQSFGGNSQVPVEWFSDYAE